MSWELAIGAGSKLLGGLLGRSKSMSPGRQLQSTVHHAVEAGKAYGFNPLTLLGVNVPQHVPANNAMLGQSVIDAGMMLADKMKGRLREADQVNRLETANRRLAKTVEKLTLRPTVGGVYARRQMTPTRAQALGLQSAGSGDADRAENADGRLLQDFTSNGVTTTLPVGPDVDELATGWFIDEVNKGKASAYAKRQYGMFGYADAKRQRFGIVPTYSKPIPRQKTKEYWSAFKAGGLNFALQRLATRKPEYRASGASGSW